MAGAGAAPKQPGSRRGRAEPERGEWRELDAVGWQHGDVPDVPDGLLEPSRVAWEVWMASWVAAHWTPDDLPGLRQLIRVYDQVERGEFQRANELRLQMDTYGLTPKGKQDRRWRAPSSARPAAPVRQIRPRKLKAV